MAYLVSRADGNLTNAATWGLADTTSAQTTLTAWTATWSGGVRTSQNFTPGAITVDGILLYVQPSSGGGTVTVSLYNATDAVPVVSVTVNVSDISEDYGPRMFAFSAVTLVAGKAYSVKVAATNSNSISFATNNTSENLWRLLRTTATQAPANNDVLFIQQNMTAAATSTAFTVTMDNTADLTIGTANNVVGMYIAKGGTLAYGYAESTAYQLKVLGFIEVRYGGTLSLGTAVNPIPSTSTAKLLFTHTVDLQGGFSTQGGSLITNGATKTLWTKLTSDAAASQAVVNVADVTGWATGDTIAISPHRATAADWDEKVILSITSLAVTCTANLGAAHQGSGIPVVDSCYVLNVTQNVVIGSSNTSYRWKCVQGTVTTYLMRYTQIKAVGHDGWTQGICCSKNAASSLDIQYCTFSDNSRSGSHSELGSNSPSYMPATLKFNNNVGYQLEACMMGFASVSGSAYGSFVYECKNNVVGRSTYHNDYTFNLNLCKGVISGNVVLAYHDYQPTFYLTSGQLVQTGDFTFEDNTLFGTNATGVTMAGVPGNMMEWVLTRLKQVRAGSGANFFQCSAAHYGLLRLVDCHMRSGQFGFRFDLDLRHGVFCLEGGIISGENATYTCNQTTFMITNQSPLRLECRGVDFTTGQGITELFTSSYTPYMPGDILFTDCKLASGKTDDTALATLVSRFVTSPVPSGLPAIAIHNTNQVVNDHRFVIPQIGFGKRDDTIYNTAAPSEKLYPRSTSYALRSTTKKLRIPLGAARTIIVYARKSAFLETPPVYVTGNRTASITVTSDLTSFNNGQQFVDGNFGTSYFIMGTQAVAGKYIQFAWATPQVITECRYYQYSGGYNVCGNWKWQGSNDAVVWTDIGAAFDLLPTYTANGCYVMDMTSMSSNQTGYRYYRLMGVSGNTTNTYPIEWEFKVAPAFDGLVKLKVAPNYSLGYKVPTVLDTLSTGFGTWGMLSALLPTAIIDTVAEVFVEVSGTMGFVNIDDWTVN